MLLEIHSLELFGQVLTEDCAGACLEIFGLELFEP